MLPFWLLLAALNPGLHLRDVAGVDRQPLKVAKGKAEALFFVTQDCPISNYYSHEIRRICDGYASRGLNCELVYIDPTISDAAAAKHAEEYGYGDYPKFVDRKHVLVEATGATVTPQAVVIRDDGKIAYSGRIDNFYAALGKPRRVVTEHDLRDALDALFAGRPIARPETPPVGCYIPGLAAFKP
jgi:hypothetical protein